MRLLVCTQIVDQNDDVLGFFHGWLKEFSTQFSSITALCLKKGTTNLPSSVQVFSLGKETSVSRLKYIYNFYRIIISQRNAYDVVLVHMNKEYILLGYPLWKLLGKKMILWYNHAHTTWTARLAARLVDEVMYTSPSSYFGSRGIGMKMSVGTDTHQFSSEHRAPRGTTILSLGRIAPVKNTLLVVQAFGAVLQSGVRAHLILAGGALPRDAEYNDEVMKAIEPFKQHVTLLGAVPHHTTPELFASADIFINLTPSGSLDKTIFEAEATGCVVVTSNDYAQTQFPTRMMNNLYVPLTENSDSNVIAAQQALQYALSMSDDDVREFQEHVRDIVVQEHSLERLARDIAQVFREVY